MLAEAEQAGGDRPLPIEDEMQAWAAHYQLQLTAVGAPVEVIESGATTRATCNELLAATYNVRRHLPTAPDPDIDRSVRRALDHFEEAGKACLRGEGGPRDLYLTLAGAGLLLAKEIAAERYDAALHVDGLRSIVMREGSSNITRRAIEAAKTMRR